MTLKASSPTAFIGYNLRGLITAYLDSRGWIWNHTSETWSLGDLQFTGDDATDQAIQWQIEHEEERPS